MPALAALALTVIAVATLIGGTTGPAYVLLFIAATLPGWPIGRALFGRHPAAWVAGGLIGYGLTALALWIPIALGIASAVSFVLSWAAVLAISLIAWRGTPALVPLPAWPANASRALALTLLLVPVLVAWPYRNIGRHDEQGARRYRAYFTADFVWHEALTAELARFESPPKNPYLASQPLHYYWTYFVLPAALVGAAYDAGTSPPIETYLAVNAMCAAVLFVGAIFMAAWSAIPRAGAVAASVALALLAASAEGLYAVFDLLRRGVSLRAFRDLNIDAITYWFFGGLTVDSLPRSLWYTPQHSMACALGLIALIIAGRGGATMSRRTAAAAGLALGLALMMSPFPGGIFTVIYAITILWDAARTPAVLPRVIGVQFVAGAFTLAALGWCLFNTTFEGAGGALAFGLSRQATRNGLTVVALAVGPVLLPCIVGFVLAAMKWFPREARPAMLGVVAAGVLFFYVTLVLEPIWIGWRAGQIFLVTAPGLIAWSLAACHDKVGRLATAIAVVVLLVIGLPTTVLDAYNAQDISHTAMGPGFRWTVVLSPGEQEALQFIEARTPPDALVQMSLEPRGRETWSLIPSFARRRMAAGLPISLLRTPDYDDPGARVDRMYETTDATEAWRIARDLRIAYIYVGAIERSAFTTGVAKFDQHGEHFGRVFSNGDSAVYAVY